MNKTLWLWLGVAAFGALGSVARYSAGLLAKLMTTYPAGTLTVNLLGAFALGWVNAALTGKGEIASGWQVVISAGLLGGFTTYSAMMLDADRMITDKDYFLAAGYLAMSFFLGLIAVRLGGVVGTALR